MPNVHCTLNKEGQYRSERPAGAIITDETKKKYNTKLMKAFCMIMLIKIL